MGGVLMQVDLEFEEWQWVLKIIGHSVNVAPWVITNPLLMKIGQQTERQANAAQERVQQGNGQLEHPRDDQVGSSAPPSNRGGAEHREAKPAKRP
jgi:hypothetical protein